MKVGMKVLVKRATNRCSKWEVAEVTKVGRKYFELTPSFGYEKYNLDNLTPVSKYSPDVEVFVNPTQAVEGETRQVVRRTLYELGVGLSGHYKLHTDVDVLLKLLSAFPDAAERVHKEMQELLDKFNTMLLE